MARYSELLTSRVVSSMSNQVSRVAMVGLVHAEMLLRVRYEELLKGLPHSCGGLAGEGRCMVAAAAVAAVRGECPLSGRTPS